MSFSLANIAIADTGCWYWFAIEDYWWRDYDDYSHCYFLEADDISYARQLAITYATLHYITYWLLRHIIDIILS
jgi:hypothetical protein